MDDAVEQAAQMIKNSRYAIAFTGAGLSRESGLPLFSEWPGFDFRMMDLEFFKTNTAAAWKFWRERFYDFYGAAVPNEGHKALARMEAQRFIRGVVTLNFDGLHQKAGSTRVFEICGTLHRLVCLQCGQKTTASAVDGQELPLRCPECGGLLKPDILFYGDLVPDPDYKLGLKEANRAKVLLVVGVSGMMMPAGVIPMLAKQRRRAKIIEINVQKSHYTDQITDIFIQQPASQALPALLQALEKDGAEKA